MSEERGGEEGTGEGSAHQSLDSKPKHLAGCRWASYSTSLSLKCLLLKRKIISTPQSGGRDSGEWRRGAREKEGGEGGGGGKEGRREEVEERSE